MPLRNLYLNVHLSGLSAMLTILCIDNDQQCLTQLRHDLQLLFTEAFAISTATDLQQADLFLSQQYTQVALILCSQKLISANPLSIWQNEKYQAIRKIIYAREATANN